MSQTSVVARSAGAKRARSGAVNGPPLLRRIHTWIGMLIAPSVLFFAATGSLQLFSLHEAHGDYTPPSLLVALGSLHKDQKLPSPPKREPAGPKAEHERRHETKAVGPATQLLKVAFLGVAVGLILSTLLGLWMALQDRRRRRTNLLLLAVGLALPLALVLGLAA